MKLSPALMSELSVCVRQRRVLLRKLAGKLSLPGPHSPGCTTAKLLQAKRKARRREQHAIRQKIHNVEQAIVSIVDLGELR